MKYWTISILIILAFVGGVLLGRHTSKQRIVETIKTDTVFFDKPVYDTIKDTVVIVKIKTQDILIPIDSIHKDEPADTIMRDSTPIKVYMRTIEYRDSTYYARVVGPKIGDLSPRLDYIETYNVTRTIEEYVPKWRIGAAAGAVVANKYSGIWVGGQVCRNVGRFNFHLDAGYDINNSCPFGQVKVGINIWEK